MARTIPLSQGLFAIVDEEDFEVLSQHKWCVDEGYAARRSKRIRIRMHREIMQPSSGMQVDHINGDKLDNRRSNLRICTHQQNQWNCGIRATNTTGYRGVRFTGKKNPWIARIKFNGQQKHIGAFATKEEAALAYNSAATELFGEFAFLNEVR